MAGKAHGTVHVKMIEAFYDPRWGLVVILSVHMDGVELGYSAYMAACSEEEASHFLPALTEHFGAVPVRASLS